MKSKITVILALLLIQSMVIGTIAVQCIDDGLVSWWDAEGDANDNKGSNDGTMMNGAGFTSGIIGTGFALDGQDDYIIIPDNETLDITGAITISVWITRYGNGIDAIVAKAGAYWLYVNSEGKVYFERSNTPWSNVHTENPLPGGGWQHILAIRYANGNATIYINGVIKATGMIAADFNTSSNPLYLGSWKGSKFNLNGSLDDVRIYSKALTSREVQALYLNSNIPGFKVPEYPLGTIITVASLIIALAIIYTKNIIH